MQEKREQDLKLNLRELGREQLIDTCVGMQDVIVGHLNTQQGYKDSVSQLNIQNAALIARTEQLEAEATGGGISSAEMDEANAKIQRLQDRCDRLQELNEKLQEKLIS